MINIFEKIKHYYTTYDYVVIPCILAILYVFVNYETINIHYNETEDFAVTALQIIRAQQFKELLGTYSRFEFNHLGPIFYYYYALTEPLLFFLKSDYSKHIVAQLFLNIVFFILCLRIIKIRLGALYPELLTLWIIIGLLPLGGSIFVNIWAPAIILFPFLLLLLSVTLFAMGELKYILWITISATLLMHSYIGTIVFVLGTVGFSSILFWKNAKGNIKNEVKRNKVYIVASIVFIAVAYFPTLYEAAINKGGNLLKVIHFFNTNSFFQHSLNRSVKYVLLFYKNILDPMVSIHRNVLVILLLSLSMLNLLRKNKFINYVLMFTIFSLALSLFAASKIVGPLHKYILNFEYMIGALFFYLSTLGFLSGIKFIWAKRDLNSRIVDAANQNLAALKLISAVVFAVLIVKCYTIPPQDNRADIDKIVEFIKPVKSQNYLVYWKKGSDDHMQWPVAAGIVLNMIRKGYHVFVPPEWGFMFGESLVSKNENGMVKINLHDSKKYKYTELSNQNMFKIRDTLVEIF